MKFIDTAKIHIKSGKGGLGCVSFRHEKFIEFGGPDGGDGGDGGSVYIQGDPHLNTLYDFQLRPHQKAGNGKNGSGKQRRGRNGEDLIIQVPLGTLIINQENDTVLLEILDESKHCILRGGKGGRGNIHFKSSTNQAPRYAQPGIPGEEMWIRLDLKIIADVGLVGFPNAGKSTLIAAISKARPKIADYPFTTLIPNLGVVKTDNFQSFVIADIPGIIEKAHLGAGLGDLFLKHIQRTTVLAFLIDCSEFAPFEPVEAYKILLNELSQFSSELLNKQRIVVLTKADVLSPHLDQEQLIKTFQQENIPIFLISSVNHQGLKPLIRELANLCTQKA